MNEVTKQARLAQRISRIVLYNHRQPIVVTLARFHKQRDTMYTSRQTAHVAEIEGPYSASVMVTSEAALPYVKYPVLLQRLSGDGLPYSEGRKTCSAGVVETVVLPHHQSRVS